MDEIERVKAMPADHREYLGIMSDDQLDRAIRILGPKLVNSIFRLSKKDLDIFEAKLTELVESKRDKTREWYKPGEWIEVK